MDMVQNLSALALRQVIGRAREVFGSEPADQELAVDFLADPSQEPSQQLRDVLRAATASAWRAVEVALLGAALWEQTKASLRRSADQVFRQQVRVFLDAVSANNPLAASTDAAVRQQCLRQLQLARQSGLLTDGPLDLNVLANQVVNLVRLAPSADLLEAEWQALEQMAGELRQAGHAELARMLVTRPDQGPPLLVSAARYFLRSAVENDPDLAAWLAPVPAGGLAASQEVGFAALAEVLTHHGDQLDKLLHDVLEQPAEPRGEERAIQNELQGLGPPLQNLGRDVVQLLNKHHLEGRPLGPRDILAVRSEPERQQILEVMARFRWLPEDQRGQLPALRHALGKLEVVAGEFEAAQRDFEETANLFADPRAQAEAWANTYRAALEQTDWDVALRAFLAATQLEPERFAPFPLADYEPERILGAGGFGVTFLCRAKASGEAVVVKALQPDYLERPVAEVFREATLLKELNHPAILRPRTGAVTEIGPPQPYLVLDAFAGVTLADYMLEHGPLAPEDLAVVARPLSEALRAAHDVGVLHRGLKPTNILVAHGPAGWQVKLIDFSLALKPEVLLAASSNPLVRTRTALGASAAGTLDYAAPEKLGRLEGAPVGPAADVYAFGRTCYFALLRTPEPDDEEKEILSLPWRRLLSACTGRTLAKRLPDFAAVLERLPESPVQEPAQVQAPDEPAAPAEAPAPEAAETRDQAPAAAPTALAHLQRGVALFNNDEHERAMAEFNEAVRLDPTNPMAYTHRGEAYRLLEDYDRAIADLSEALRLEPQNAVNHINRGIAFRLKGEFDKAIADYTQSLRHDPANALAYNNRGNAFADKGLNDQAIADYSEALRIDSRYARAYLNRGSACIEKGEFERAIADFTQVLQLEPNDPVAYTNRGDAQRHRGDYDQAIADYTEALRLDPNYTLAYANRGDAYRLKGEYDRSIADFTEALGLDPTNALIFRNRGVAYRLKGEHDRAITDFSQAVRLDPTYALAFNNRGNVYSAKGEYDRAIADFTEALRLEPQLALAFMNRALAYAKKGNFDAVITDCMAAVKLDNKLAAAHFILGAALANKNEHDKAIVAFSRALKSDPKYALAYNDRGLAYAHKSEYDRAIADYTEALKIDPKYTLAYANRGIALRLKGDYENAIADFTRALKLDNRLALAYYHRGLAFVGQEEFDKAIADYTLAHRLDPHNPDIFTRRDEALQAKNEHLKKRKERRQREATARAEEERRQREAAAYFIRAKSHADKGEHDDAIIDFTEAVRLDLRDVTALYQRGMCYVARQDHDLAVADFTEVLRLNPRHVDALYQRGLAHRVKGRYDKAIADFTHTLQMSPHHLDAGGRLDEAIRAKQERPRVEEKRGAAGLVSKANSSFDKGEYDRAIADCTEALRQDPNNKEAFQARALAYEQKGEYDKAIADYTEVLRLEPRDANALQFRGNVHMRQGDYDRAIVDFTHAIKLDPESAFGYYNRGLASLAKDEYVRAIADFTRALRLDLQYAVAYGYRGQAYRLNGEYDKAIADCKEALRLDPQYALAYRNRGLAYAAKGEHARAKLDYEASLRLDPSLAPT